MQNEKLKNIDKFMKASDIIELLEKNKSNTETRYRTFVRSDGVAKKGKSLAANAASHHIYAIDAVIRLLEFELKECMEDKNENRI